MHPSGRTISVAIAGLATVATATRPARANDQVEVLDARVQLESHEEGACDKYCWHWVKVLAGSRLVGKSIRVGTLSSEPGITASVSTLQLYPYNTDHPNGPWRFATPEEIQVSAKLRALRAKRETVTETVRRWVKGLREGTGDLTGVTALPFAFRNTSSDGCAKEVETAADLRAWRSCFREHNRPLIEALAWWDDSVNDGLASAPKRMRPLANKLSGSGAWIRVASNDEGIRPTLLLRLRQEGDQVRITAAISDLDLGAQGAATIKHRAENDAFTDAIERDDPAVIRRLLGGGANPNEHGDDIGPTDPPITRAAEKGRLEIVEILLAAGARPNACCCSCVTALHRAIIGGHRAVVERLLAGGANPRIPYDHHIPTLDLARRHGSLDIVRLVEEALARAPAKSK